MQESNIDYKNSTALGRIFAEAREERGITQAAVAENLLTQRAISNFEQKGEVPNRLVLNVLIQRIGWNADCFITLLTRQEYEYLSWREDIIGSIQDGTVRAEEFESEMALSRSIHGVLQEQFADFWRGYVQNDIGLMKKAIALTVSGYPGAISAEVCVSTEEITYILLCIEKHLSLKPEEWREEQEVLESLLIYAEERLQEDERVKVYGKLACLYGRHMQDVDSNDKLAIYKKALELQRRQAYLYNLRDVLNGLLGEAERLGQKLPEEYERYLDALAKIQEELKIEENSPVHVVSCQEYYLLHEVLKDYRREKQVRVQEIADRVCSEKTYRALENGRRSAQRGTYELLAEMLDIPFGVYSSDIVTDKYSDLKLLQEYKTLSRQQKEDEAMEELENLEKSLAKKMEIVQNRQFIDGAKIVTLILKRQISPSEYRDKIEQLIQLAIPGWTVDYAPRFYTRQEMKLVYYDAIAYRRLEEYDTALKLLENLWERLENSGIDKLHRLDEVLLILALWKDLLTDVEKYDAAFEKAREGCFCCFASGKGHKLDRFVYELGWCLEKLNPALNAEQKRERCAWYFKCALSISQLFYLEEDQSVIERYIRKRNY